MPKTLLSVFSLGLLFLPASPATAESDLVPEVEVPFACGRSYPVSQAHDVGSHLHNDTFAWDFRMPEGTPIVSAMDGVVRLARGDSTVGGCDMQFARDANYVVVQHAGGLETQYLHFVQVNVKAGEAVKKGQLLGYSGRTGWACGAHLHFKVAKTTADGWNNPSVLAHVAGYGDPQAGVMIQAPGCGAERPYIASLDVRAPSEGAAQLAQRVELAARREAGGAFASPQVQMPVSGSGGTPRHVGQSAAPGFTDR